MPLMTKRQEIDDPNSSLNKAADDEPVFVLRAQDRFAPAIISAWAARVNTLSPVKAAGARETAKAMIEWQRRIAVKTPD